MTNRSRSEVLSPAPSTFASGTCRVVVERYCIDLCAVGGRGSHLPAILYSAMWTDVPCGHSDIYAHPDFRFMCFCVRSVITRGTSHAIHQVSGNCQRLIGPSCVTDRKMDSFFGKGDRNLGNAMLLYRFSPRFVLLSESMQRNKCGDIHLLTTRSVRFGRKLRQSSGDTETT